MNARVPILERVAVVSLLDLPLLPLKCLALYFDKIAVSTVMYFGGKPEVTMCYYERSKLLANGELLEELRRLGIVTRTQWEDQDRQDWVQIGYSVIRSGSKGKALEESEEIEGGGRLFKALYTKAYAQYLADKVLAVPVYSSEDSFSLEFLHGPSTCLSVIIKALPVPDPETDWSRIIAFRQDDEARRKLVALRSWSNEIERQKLSPYEIADKLADLINQYRVYMEHQRMKVYSGTVETVLKVSAEVCENLARLKLTEVVDALFSFRRRELQLSEAELAAPGREVSYIVRAREFFPQK